MANIAVAGQAVRLLALGIVEHAAGQALMASNAVGDGNFPIKRPYAQWIGELAGSKCETVIPAINPFCKVLTKQAFGSVTAVAVGNLFVGRMIPRVELFAHDVAVQAGLGIVEKIGAAPSIDEGKQRQTNQNAKHSNHEPGESVCLRKGFF
jgi:hypothetical protein